MSPDRSLSLRGWRLSAAAVVCAAAGAGLQRIMVSGDAAPRAPVMEGTSGAGAEPSAIVAKAPAAASLQALSVPDKLSALAAALPHMKTADLLPLVETLARNRRVIAAAYQADPFSTMQDTVSPLLRAVLLRWAELDADEMLAFVESGEFQYDYDTRRLAVLALAEVRGAAALEPLRLKSPLLVRIAAREMLVRQPALLDSLLPLLQGAGIYEHPGLIESGPVQMADALDTPTFLRLAMGLDDRERFTGALLGRLSFLEAMQTAKSLPPGKWQDAALLALLEQMPSLENPADEPAQYGGLSFRTEFESLPPGEVRDALTSRYVRIIAREDPDAAVKTARTLTDSRLRSQALEEIYGVLPEDADPAFTTHLLAEAWLAHPDSHKVGRPSDLPLGEFASSFPVTPTVPISGFPVTPVSENYISASFRAWLEASPKEAEAWLQTVQQRDLRTELTQVLLAKPGYDLSLIEDSEQRLAYAWNLLNPLRSPFDTSPAEPHPMAHTLPEDLAALARLHHLNQVFLSDTEWAALSPDERQMFADKAVQWLTMDNDMQPALDFFNALPPEERTLGAWYQAGRAYINKDPSEASQWMESLPAGAERDAVATALIERLTAPGASRDGEAAFAWAASMSGDAERARHTAEAARVWALEDPAAARAAITRAALPESEKQALLRTLPEGGAR